MERKYKNGSLWRSERSGRTYQYYEGRMYLHSPDPSGDQMKVGAEYLGDWRSLPLTEVAGQPTLS